MAMSKLPLIVFAQFACTSLWFAGNALLGPLAETFHLDDAVLPHLTSAVQLGFITGTLLFALLNLADRMSPSKLFFINALLGALFNLAMVWEGNTLESLLGLRFLTGLVLAGIYPVGMKIAADYFEKGLGLALGYLVGALVLGTAFPHLLNSLGSGYDWTNLVFAISGLALTGGLMVFIGVPDGPYRKAGKGLQVSALKAVFRIPAFRKAAFGYFGHMWELYTFWALVPWMLRYHFSQTGIEWSISAWSFGIIAIGGLACVLGGYLAVRYGAAVIAHFALGISGVACLLSPWVLASTSSTLVLTFLLIWGMAVIADSPLFSSLVAQASPAEIRGSALTLVNSIGFSITILSIQLLFALLDKDFGLWPLLFLAIGPASGLLYIAKKTQP
ncbi:MAG: MFS transporter [Bacteroidetes bacterium]|nr:MAG: MFS transporter [Bacteroidota bacterium]